jgi:ketosteroid isomerase-like protein
MSEGRAVPQKNVEVVRRVVAALNARDLEGYLACCSEDVELHLPVVAGVYEGAEGIKRWFADIEDAGPDFHMNLRGVKAIGGNQVLAFLHVASTGRASGIPLTMETANIYELIDDKISRIRIFLDRSEALKAVGLEG